MLVRMKNSDQCNAVKKSYGVVANDADDYQQVECWRDVAMLAGQLLSPAFLSSFCIIL